MKPSHHTHASILAGTPHRSCRAVVIIPARDEEERLPTALSALRWQVDDLGARLDLDTYEIIVFLNNCSDRSAERVGAFCQQSPELNVLWMEAFISPAQAHVGTARRLLMDAACQRLRRTKNALSLQTAILSTDADTVVASDWIYRNLEELSLGADAVGGTIEISPEDLSRLDPGTRSAYRSDRAYRARVAHLESLLDPDDADPWPRHLEHFGASLACTPEMYLRVGGMPAVTPLEDVAFIDGLRRSDARIRHSPRVRVYTSARFNGRTRVGFSGQLGNWKRDALKGEPHLVESCAWLVHRFTNMRRLRVLHASRAMAPPATYPSLWRTRIAQIRDRNVRPAAFLEQLDCDRLIEETFGGKRHAPISEVLPVLDETIQRHLTQNSSSERTLEVQDQLQLQS